MTIRLYEKQVDVLAEFMSNMAVVWFAAAFINPASSLSIVMYSGYGLLCLYAAINMKGDFYGS